MFFLKLVKRNLFGLGFGLGKGLETFFGVGFGVTEGTGVVFLGICGLGFGLTSGFLGRTFVTTGGRTTFSGTVGIGGE